MVLLLLQTGAEIGVLSTLPFDKIHVNMFLIEMFHFTGDKEKQVTIKIHKICRSTSSSTVESNEIFLASHLYIYGGASILSTRKCL